jgi:hypothetical protein
MSNRSYGQWPLRIHQARSDWTISYHDPQGKIIHLMTAESQIAAYRAADKLASLYGFDGESLLTGTKGEQIIDIHKIMHFRDH